MTLLHYRIKEWSYHADHAAYNILPRQNKMSENTDESKMETVILTVLKPVCFGHFILSR